MASNQMDMIVQRDWFEVGEKSSGLAWTHTSSSCVSTKKGINFFNYNLITSICLQQFVTKNAHLNLKVANAHAVFFLRSTATMSSIVSYNRCFCLETIDSIVFTFSRSTTISSMTSFNTCDLIIVERTMTRPDILFSNEVKNELLLIVGKKDIILGVKH